MSHFKKGFKTQGGLVERLEAQVVFSSIPLVAGKTPLNKERNRQTQVTLMWHQNYWGQRVQLSQKGKKFFVYKLVRLLVRFEERRVVDQVHWK